MYLYDIKNLCLGEGSYITSNVRWAWRDLNSRSTAYKTGALTRLSYRPIVGIYVTIQYL